MTLHAGEALEVMRNAAVLETPELFIDPLTYLMMMDSMARHGGHVFESISMLFPTFGQFLPAIAYPDQI